MPQAFGNILADAHSLCLFPCEEAVQFLDLLPVLPKFKMSSPIVFETPNADSGPRKGW